MYTQNNYYGYSLTLADVHDVPLVIINEHCIELKGLSPIVTEARTAIVSKTDILEIFVWSSPTPFQFYGYRRGAGVPKGMRFHQTVRYYKNQLKGPRRVIANPSEYL